MAQIGIPKWKIFGDFAHIAGILLSSDVIGVVLTDNFPLLLILMDTQAFLPGLPFMKLVHITLGPLMIPTNSCGLFPLNTGEPELPNRCVLVIDEASLRAEVRR